MIFLLFFLVDAADDGETMVYAVLHSVPIPGWLLITTDSVCMLHTDWPVFRPMQCHSIESLKL